MFIISKFRQKSASKDFGWGQPAPPPFLGLNFNPPPPLNRGNYVAMFFTQGQGKCKLNTCFGTKCQPSSKVNQCVKDLRLFS